MVFELEPEAARINASPSRVGAHAVTAVAVLGAASTDTVPTWAFLAMGGVARGLGGYRIDGTFVLSIVSCGVGLHLLTCPSLSVLSVAAALCATAVACLAGYAGRRMITRALSLQRRAQVAAELAAEARERRRDLAVAMSLHDGLSGMLFGLRAKLEQAADVAEVRSVARAFVGRARELLASMSESVALGAALRELSSTDGVPHQEGHERTP
jgi:hypothetical protein